MLLENKVAIIAGGARGMGGAIALKFAENGCSCVIADVLDDKGRETVEEVKKIGRDALYVHCDVSDGQQVRDMVAQAIDKYKKIDQLVISAGIGASVTFLDKLTEEAWDKMMAINCKGTYLCIQAIAPHMQANNSGNIIVIVSMAGEVPSPVNWHYHASKAAQLMVAKGAANLLARNNIRVNIINPGMILTDMSAVFSGPGVEDVEAHQKEMAKNMVPLVRLGTTDDIAKAALFLASEQSSYITGDSIHVSGGSGIL